MEIKKLTEHNERCPRKDAEMLLRVFPKSTRKLMNEINYKGGEQTMNYSEIQKSGMTVRELISILNRCDQSLPIATEAMGHVYASKGDRDSHGLLRVCLLHHYSGYHILIGNPSVTDINKPNWYIVEDLTPDLDEYPLTKAE